MKLPMRNIAVLLILTAIAVTSLAITPVMAQPVEARVNAPEYVEEGATFVATIDVDDVTDLNSAQFDLSFDSSVVKVSDVNEGEIDGEDVPIFDWRFVDTDTVMVIIMMPIGESLSGSGYLAEIEFKVKGKEGEKSELNLSNGELVNATTGGIIPSNWHGAEVKIAVEEKDDEEDEEDEEEKVGEEVTPVSSNITAWKPAEAVVNDTVGESRTFNISVGQISVISWQINGTEVQTNESTREAVFTKSADIGSWNVSAIATNSTAGLSDLHTWIWCVAATATVTPAPTLAPVVTSTPEAETEVKPTLSPTAPPATDEKPTPTPTPPGFEAILAIAVMPIAYNLLRRGGR